MKLASTKQWCGQAGFGKPGVILFLLLILSLLAAAFCFIQANLKTTRNHRLMDAAGQFKVVASQLVITATMPQLSEGGPDNKNAGNQLLKSLRAGDSSERVPPLPELLLPELDAIDNAWSNFLSGLVILEGKGNASNTTIVSPDQFEALKGLSGSLDGWLKKIKVDKSKIEYNVAVGEMLRELQEATASKNTSNSDQSIQSLARIWNGLRVKLDLLSEIKDADANVLLDEMQVEVARLSPLFESSSQSAATLTKSNLSNIQAKNIELQLVLDKMQAAVMVLEHEQNYLFRLGVVAALFSLLFLFILAIVFWRDSQYKIAQSKSNNATNQRAILRLLDEITNLAEGDLTTRATVTEDITGAIADSVNYAIDTINALVKTLNNTSKRVAVAVAQSSGTARRLSRASGLQEREIRRSSNYITAMANTMKQMSVKAAQAKEVANQSVLRALSGHSAVSETIESTSEIRQQIQDTSKRLKRLGESSQQIGDIINLVNDIAERTNLLALNASIQATSSSGQDRFSSVADEVQKLAERVNEATRDIEALVVAIQIDTRAAITSMEESTAGVVNVSSLAESAGVELSEIQLVSQELSDKIQTLSEKALRQAEVTSKLSGNMRVISDIAIQSNEGIKSTADSIAGLQAMSDDLVRIAAEFTVSESESDDSDKADESDVSGDSNTILNSKILSHDADNDSLSSRND